MTVDTFGKPTKKTTANQPSGEPQQNTGTASSTLRQRHRMPRQHGRWRDIGRVLHRCGNAKCLTTGGHANPLNRRTNEILNPDFSRENSVMHRDREAYTDNNSVGTIFLKPCKGSDWGD